MLALAWWWRSGPDRDRDDVLGVLALAFLLRCLLDPWDLVYYHLPLVVSLAAWEARRGRDLPVLSVVVTAACWLTFVVYDARSGSGPYLAYLAWAIPLAVGLAVTLLRPVRAPRAAPGHRRRRTGPRVGGGRRPATLRRPMSRRSDQRRAAVFALYQHELTGRSLDDLFERDAAGFTRALAHATSDHQEELDARIARHAEGWALERIAPLERAIMRVALLEMLHPDLIEGDRPIPPEGAITEAVETAKEFCAAQAAGFVNGILARGAALRAREWRLACLTRAWTSSSTRLERAAAELRAGELAPERAAALVDECARLASRPARSSTGACAAARPAVRRRRASSRSDREHARARQRRRARRGGLPRPPARAVEDYLGGLRFAREPAAAGLEEAMRYSLLAGRQADPARCSRSPRRGRSGASHATCCRSPPRSS